LLEKAGHADVLTHAGIGPLIATWSVLKQYWHRPMHRVWVEAGDVYAEKGKISVGVVLLNGQRLGEEDGLDECSGVAASNGTRGEDAVAADPTAARLPYLPTEMWHRILEMCLMRELCPRAGLVIGESLRIRQERAQRRKPPSDPSDPDQAGTSDDFIERDND